MNLTQTADDFNKYPSESKKQEIERNVESVSIDYGHYRSSGKKHKILLENDTNSDPY